MIIKKNIHAIIYERLLILTKAEQNKNQSGGTKTGAACGHHHLLEVVFLLPLQCTC